jgi:hypothetical protein
MPPIVKAYRCRILSDHQAQKSVRTVPTAYTGIVWSWELDGVYPNSFRIVGMKKFVEYPVVVTQM